MPCPGRVDTVKAIAAGQWWTSQTTTANIWLATVTCQSGKGHHHLGRWTRAWVWPAKTSQFLQMKARRTRKRRVERDRPRVFMSGTTQLATADTNTSSTAMRANSTLISLPRRVRAAAALSRPSSWTTCCCCCCSSILDTRVWQASSASCRTTQATAASVKIFTFTFNRCFFSRATYICQLL